jgi:hypothetical protein
MHGTKQGEEQTETTKNKFPDPNYNNIITIMTECMQKQKHGAYTPKKKSVFEWTRHFSPPCTITESSRAPERLRDVLAGKGICGWRWVAGTDDAWNPIA